MNGPCYLFHRLGQYGLWVDNWLDAIQIPRLSASCISTEICFTWSFWKQPCGNWNRHYRRWVTRVATPSADICFSCYLVLKVPSVSFRISDWNAMVQITRTQLGKCPAFRSIDDCVPVVWLTRFRLDVGACEYRVVVAPLWGGCGFFYCTIPLSELSTKSFSHHSSIKSRITWALLFPVLSQTLLMMASWYG